MWDLGPLTKLPKSYYIYGKCSTVCLEQMMNHVPNSFQMQCLVSAGTYEDSSQTCHYNFYQLLIGLFRRLQEGQTAKCTQSHAWWKKLNIYITLATSSLVQVALPTKPPAGTLWQLMDKELFGHILK